MAGSVTVQSASLVETGLPQGVTQTKTIGPSILSGFGNTIAVQDIALASGDNQILAPVGATWCVLFLTANPNNATITAGKAADTGHLPLNTAGPVLEIVSFSTPSGTSPFWVNTSATGVVVSASYW